MVVRLTILRAYAHQPLVNRRLPCSVWMKVGFLMMLHGSWGKVLRKVVMPCICILKRLFWDMDVSKLLGG